MALRPPQKWVIGGTLAGVALFASYKLFHRSRAQALFLPSGRAHGEYESSEGREVHEHEHERGEYGRNKHHHHRKHHQHC